MSVPERGLENTAYCCYCSSPAEVNCLDCEESMCKLCFDSLHCKGQRRLGHVHAENSLFKLVFVHHSVLFCFLFFIGNTGK